MQNEIYNRKTCCSLERACYNERLLNRVKHRSQNISFDGKFNLIGHQHYNKRRIRMEIKKTTPPYPTDVQKAQCSYLQVIIKKLP